MMTVIGIEMCSNRQYLYVITVVSVNTNGERRHIQYSILILRYFLLSWLTSSMKSERSIQHIVDVHLLPCIANL
jgi:hypothetical protein